MLRVLKDGCSKLLQMSKQNKIALTKTCQTVSFSSSKRETTDSKVTMADWRA